MLLKPIAAVILMGTFALAARSDDTKDGDAIQGTWLPLAGEIWRGRFPDAELKTFKLMFKDDKCTVTIEKEDRQGTFKLNPAAKPKEMDITGTADNPNLAIYELDGDTLRICFDLSGKSRPTEFKTKKRTQLFLVTFKGEKP